MVYPYGLGPFGQGAFGGGVAAISFVEHVDVSVPAYARVYNVAADDAITISLSLHHIDVVVQRVEVLSA